MIDALDTSLDFQPSTDITLIEDNCSGGRKHVRRTTYNSTHVPQNLVARVIDGMDRSTFGT